MKTRDGFDLEWIEGDWYVTGVDTEGGYCDDHNRDEPKGTELKNFDEVRNHNPKDHSGNRVSWTCCNWKEYP